MARSGQLTAASLARAARPLETTPCPCRSSGVDGLSSYSWCLWVSWSLPHRHGKPKDSEWTRSAHFFHRIWSDQTTRRASLPILSVFGPSDLNSTICRSCHLLWSACSQFGNWRRSEFYCSSPGKLRHHSALSKSWLLGHLPGCFCYCTCGEGRIASRFGSTMQGEALEEKLSPARDG